MQTFVACSDNHGDMIDPDARLAFLRFVDDFQPDYRLHLGDLFDLRAMRNGASDDEKSDGVQADIEAGMEFIEAYRPDVLLWGNHDHRLFRAAESGTNGVLRSLACLLIDQIADRLDAIGVKRLPYCKRNGVHEWGGMRWIHGYGHGIYAPRQAAQAYGSVCMGHIHTWASHTDASLDARVGYSIPALCRLDLGYNAAHMATLRQVNGWAYGFTDGKTCTILPAIMRDGRVHTMTGVKSYGR